MLTTRATIPNQGTTHDALPAERFLPKPLPRAADNSSNSLLYSPACVWTHRWATAFVLKPNPGNPSALSRRGGGAEVATLEAGDCFGEVGNLPKPAHNKPPNATRPYTAVALGRPCKLACGSAWQRVFVEKLSLHVKVDVDRWEHALKSPEHLAGCPASWRAQPCHRQSC